MGNFRDLDSKSLKNLENPKIYIWDIKSWKILLDPEIRGTKSFDVKIWGRKTHKFSFLVSYIIWMSKFWTCEFLSTRSTIFVNLRIFRKVRKYSIWDQLISEVRFRFMLLVIGRNSGRYPGNWLIFIRDTNFCFTKRRSIWFRPVILAT